MTDEQPPPTSVSRRKASGHDIARHAGVSQSTVSRVINDYPSISDATRERVRRAMEELGYTPNAAARTRSPDAAT
jgi:DNA-binding LacI/PurR family transcriptional regulator